MPVLDTNFLIALQKREPAAEALLHGLRDQPLLVPAVVAAEFLTFFGEDRVEAQRLLEAAYTLLHTSSAWISAAAAHRRTLHAERRLVRTADAWIGAWAIVQQTFVVTRNTTDFEAIHVPTRTW